MLKSIPKSNISRRPFKVYKLFTASESDYIPISASSDFDDVNNPLYRSIQNKYYADNGLVQNFGTLQNPANFIVEREFAENIYVLVIDQEKYGEQIKKNSFSLIDNGVNYVDDGFGKITGPNPSYIITGSDFQQETLTITQDSVEYELGLFSFDSQTGILQIIDNGVPESYNVVSIDFKSGVLILTDPLDIEGVPIIEVSYGNIFYSEGLIIITATDEISLTNYSLLYRATQTIHETEVLVEVKAGEFNYSQNPSAVNVNVSSSIEFTTTAITNVSPEKTHTIKYINNITQRNGYTGSYQSGSIVTGSWYDYDNNKLSDPTGSYLAPYITTIGLYDDSGDMVAIAKLPTPIKNLPDYDMNFIVRFDT